MLADGGLRAIYIR